MTRSRHASGYGPPMSETADSPEGSVAVLIADDQALVRAGFRAILEEQPGIRVVGEAGDGRDAIDLVRRRHPDVVLMDIQMPDIDGLEAARRILAEADAEHPVAILMLTTFDLNEYVYDALRAGASGFLLKDVLPEQLIAAVRVVAGGDALIAPTITKRLIEQFSRAAPPRIPPAAVQELTQVAQFMFGRDACRHYRVFAKYHIFIARPSEAIARLSKPTAIISRSPSSRASATTWS